MKKLAIIIPAYKNQYFREALNSLANQTDKRFNVYIGDDNSPFELESIVNDFKNLLNIEYFKFSNNIGAEKLVHQWTRCVALSVQEEWLWLFSDDDIADPCCVESFYNTIEGENGDFDVFRFNTTVINHWGTILNVSPVGPSIESSAEMAYHLLLGKRGNSMPDHIFSRRIYEITGGFVYTSYAQAADWATSIKFSKAKGIRIIPQAILYWRYGGLNISSLASKNKSEMARGHFEFLAWVCHHFKYLLRENNSVITYNDIKKAGIINLKNIIKSHYQGINSKMILPIIHLLTQNFNMGFIGAIRFIYNLRKPLKVKHGLKLLFSKYTD